MNNHPQSLMLRAYASGDIDEATALIVATHLESCAECRAQVKAFEQEFAQAAFDTDACLASLNTDDEQNTLCWQDMFDEIVDQPVAAQSAPVKSHFDIDVNGQTFSLPPALQSIRPYIGKWRNFGGKVMSAKIDLGGEHSPMNLLYIAPGVTIPRHTHQGIESTLILHGGFSDEDGHYHQGDMMVRDASIEHSPKTSELEDCLCLTVLTERMVFTQGIARVFNWLGNRVFP
ncbi:MULTISPECIES: ChrR family anti-sigma-E factor [unclassified Vibrio]|uniref:ChrR family anti-sigma-E factor n=1 Tax=Vibrio sp. HB236076 TaxID=3232307 RepID=A0AB39HC14_9VIBR|nr:ChrR family anti-sigma-E factor [Vibrio sp. HB161653]MDP5254893.1 ChrR family anti-sigma-E factor [Vibrio sp. HB161653]